MKKTLLVLGLFASLSIAPTAFACSPAPDWPPTASENLARKDVAFIGTVKSVIQDKSANAPYRITFEVDETYKGSLEETVMIETRFSSAACGYDDGYKTFEKGTVWAIYANGSASDGYSTDSLSLNTEYKSVSAAKDALKKLGLTPVDENIPIACTMQYAPVCGKDASGNEKTYGNSCVLGADKATFVHEGECVSIEEMPATDLWIGMRGAGVTWLQGFLAKQVGIAASALKAAGATGYFGALTKAALAEFQSAHNITPASGYFGPKTRAEVHAYTTPAETATFSGTISAVDTACFADGICSVTIGGKKVIVMAGYRLDTAPPLGSLKGVDSVGDLEGKIGSKAEVYAAKTTDGGNDYTLYGSTAFYVKVLGE